MTIAPFLHMLPILVVILSGYVMGRLLPIDSKTLATVAADFFMPALLFISMATTDLEGSLVSSLIGSSISITAMLLIVAFIWAKLAGQEPSKTVPSLVFMNSGFLAIPLMKLYGGNLGMNMSVIFDFTQSFAMFTVGVFIITGGLKASSIKAAFASPIIWATVSGLLVRTLAIPIPETIREIFLYAGDGAPALASFALGVSLKDFKLTLKVELISALFVRFVGGFLIGLLAANLFGLQGMAKVVVTVTAALPSAIFTSVLPIRHNKDANFATTMVLLSTLLGAFTIPLSFALMG
ncbi:MAG: Membrane transport protein [Spirochaetes bacterium ADurb.Bin315]|nr:MAG: Membrane transport protein [Spirochaetes bacterium ADurb.Bin315]